MFVSVFIYYVGQILRSIKIGYDSRRQILRSIKIGYDSRRQILRSIKIGYDSRSSIFINFNEIYLTYRSAFSITCN